MARSAEHATHIRRLISYSNCPECNADREGTDVADGEPANEDAADAASAADALGVDAGEIYPKDGL
jgi:hypothetical protein